MKYILVDVFAYKRGDILKSSIFIGNLLVI